MSLVSQEILAQFEALEQTLSVFDASKAQIQSFLKGKKLLLTGCGSSYTLCVSAAWMLAARGVDAFAVPSGDLICQPEAYAQRLRDAVLVVPSRSGKTSECLIAMDIARQAGAEVFAITADPASPLATGADMAVNLPFAYDHAICQTRNVSCFYTAFVWLTAMLAGDQALDAQLRAMVAELPAFFKACQKPLEELAFSREWGNVFVLSDGATAGLGAEAALAFCEIAQVGAVHQHLLDVRHGPMVLARPHTLVLALSHKAENSYLPPLIADFMGPGHGCGLALIAPANAPAMGETVRLPLSERDQTVAGLALIVCAQWLALQLAHARKHDPDKPDGLTAWIKL